jgi:hypothetical protein
MTDADAVPTAPIALVALFVTALVTAQLVSSKLLAFSLPLLGALSMPGGTLAYAGTYFASDCVSELYGKRFARRVVNVGFFMNFVMLGLVWATIQWPAAANSPLASDTFATVLGSGTNIVLGSLLAYLVSQNWDVFAFHWLRDATDGKWLWLRNIGSTGTSQLVDTIIFTAVAFGVAPALLGIGQALPVAALVPIVVGQYVGKLVVAVLDTPLVYAVVGVLREDDATTERTAAFSD